MPKIVQPEQRRDLIADALFDVLREGGVSSVTLARVADRAGLAIGSVRHFLGTHEEMLEFAFETAARRIRDRVTRSAQSLLSDLDAGASDAQGRLSATADLLCELVPLDRTRREEAIVWLEFENLARTDSRLAATSRRAAAETAGLLATVVESALQRGAIAPRRDVALEAARLAALIDGLTVRAVLHPELLSATTARSIVLAHLQDLRGSQDGGARPNPAPATGRRPPAAR